MRPVSTDNGLSCRCRRLSSRGIHLPGASSVSLLLVLLTFTFAADVHAQAAASQKPQAPAAATAASGVDTVIALVKSKLPEAMIIRTLKQEGKAYKLSPADLLKLTSAGVSEAIIDAMSEGGGAVVAADAPVTSAAPPAAGGATPFPPDLPDAQASRGRRRMAVSPFDYSTVISWVQYWFNSPYNIGDGIRAMLTVRMAQSNTITLLEREKIDQIMKEQDFGASNRVRQGTAARIGQISGADVNLYGDIVIFGRDDTTKRKGAAAVVGGLFGRVAGAAVAFNKEEKAVVGINLRLVDTETGEVIETAEARGESSRSSKDYAGVLGVAGAGAGVAAGGATGMTSSNFQQTIIGEATSNAVSKVVEYLETRVPKLPAKPRAIEGRVAVIGPGTATLALGSSEGVLRGDRFEILQINGEIRDPATKEVIDIEAVKIGELVVDTVREKTAAGAYGGQPMSSASVAGPGKGYAARLMSK
jgi:curli biogenesis system outer membrane secretion channel CsgG